MDDPCSNVIEKACKEPESVDINFDKFNESYVSKVLSNIDNISEHDLSVIIKNNMERFTEDVLNGDESYAHLLSNKKFVSSLFRAINSIPISYSTKLAINRITYDYFTSDNPEREIKEIYLNASKVVNKDAITKLMTIGLDPNVACNLALCRYSSSNEKTNVKRLNFAIYHRYEIMTEQIIIYIYEKLFDNFSDLFQATMLEVYSKEQQNDFGENFMEVYGLVSLAILVFLNNMTSENIRKVLIRYEEELKLLSYPPVRFSLRALSNDYSRVLSMVDKLNMSGHYIP